jgi:mono/diheme cytochrome c family protein
MPVDAGKNKKPPKFLGVFVVFILVAVAGSIVVYSLSDWRAPAKAKKMQNPVPPTGEAIGAGMMIYMQHCQSCQGEEGDGKGEKAGELLIAPADFRDAHKMSLSTDGEFFWQISEGHRPMPAFKGKLTAEERWQVIDYIRTFTKTSGNSGVPAHP